MYRYHWRTHSHLRLCWFCLLYSRSRRLAALQFDKDVLIGKRIGCCGDCDTLMVHNHYTFCIFIVRSACYGRFSRRLR